MATISARHYRVVDSDIGWLHDTIRFRRRLSWWPITSRVYYLHPPSPLLPLTGLVQRRRRGRWGRRVSLSKKVTFALVAAAIRDGALTVNSDT